MSVSACCLSLDVCPDLLQKNTRCHSSTCSCSDLNREQRVERRLVLSSHARYMFSLPLWHTASTSPSCSSGIHSKYFCRKWRQAQLLIGRPFGSASKENHVNLTRSKSLHQLMYELEEPKNELLLVKVFLT